LFHPQPHAVEVVDDKINNGQMINLGKVDRFVEGTAIGCPLAHLADHDFRGTAIGNREGRPGGQRDLAADDGVATHKVTVDVKQMHRAATAMRAACLLAE
jgi:hypothetical protein